MTKGGEEIFAELSGNLLYSADSACDLPTTGDWVYADFFANGAHAIINSGLTLRGRNRGCWSEFEVICRRQKRLNSLPGRQRRLRAWLHHR